ncbi:MAG: hypothetical protein R3A47_10005 [Polyangiales bacterium]
MGGWLPCTGTITQELRRFIEAQRKFCRVTAPLSETGHVNLSPKGLQSSFASSTTRLSRIWIMSEGAETIAHSKRMVASSRDVLRVRTDLRTLYAFTAAVRYSKRRIPIFATVAAFSTVANIARLPLENSVRAVIVVHATAH